MDKGQTEHARPLYKIMPLSERQRVAEDCLRGGNSCREIYAAEIIKGDLFDRDGRPKSYWHCLATYPPPEPPGRRGQWKAEPDADNWEGISRAFVWDWQDWGPR